MFLLSVAEESVHDVDFIPVEGGTVHETHPPQTGGAILCKLLLHVLSIFHTLLHIHMLAASSKLTEDLRHAEIT